MSLSKQARYRRFFVLEGDTKEGMNWRLGDVGHLGELGRAIRITCRNYVKNTSIQLCYCVFQYKRCLKTERYVDVQVVLLSTLILTYQGYYFEVVLKYRGRDTSESSLVFPGPKDREAESASHYFHNPQVKL